MARPPKRKSICWPEKRIFCAGPFFLIPEANDGKRNSGDFRDRNIDFVCRNNGGDCGLCLAASLDKELRMASVPKIIRTEIME